MAYQRKNFESLITSIQTPLIKLLKSLKVFQQQFIGS